MNSACLEPSKNIPYYIVVYHYYNSILVELSRSFTSNFISGSDVDSDPEDMGEGDFCPPPPPPVYEPGEPPAMQFSRLCIKN